MAQSGFTPILLYASGTPGNSPSAGNLTSSASGAELAVNYADGKLFYKDSGGSVQTLATKGTGSIGGSTTQVQYNLSGALAGSANLTFNGTTLTANSAAVSTGNLSFSGTAQRITGDMSNATVANRLMFQTSTVNSSTSVTALPNGTNTQADFFAFNNSDPTNASLLLLRATTSETTLRSGITGTGTYLPMTFYTGGSERMRIDTSGNVGIGTASPGAKLQINVQDGFRFDVGAGAKSFMRFGSANTGEGTAELSYTRSTGAIAISTGSPGGSFPARLFIDSFGNVGIGTGGSPGEKLAVVGNIVAGNTSTTADGYLDIDSGGAGKVRITRTGTGATASSMVFSTQFTTLQERMRITDVGNVGIGTASPGARFEVSSSLNQAALFKTSGTGAYGCVQIFNTNTNGEASIGFRDNSDSDATSWVIGKSVGATDALGFYYGSTRMVIDTSGNLLVGATSTVNSARIYSLSSTGVALAGRNSSAAAGKFWSTPYIDNNNTHYIINQDNAGVYIADGATAWTANSDERLKTDLKPIENAATKVASLRAVTGRFKTDEPGVSRAFLIAQDVLAVLPEAVNTSNPEQLGVAYTDTIPLLVAAIKEQQATIETLTRRIAALEAKG